MTVTFFGHRDTPETIYPIIEKALSELVEQDNATMFYVGNNGNFDHMVRIALQKLQVKYPYIQYKVVLAFKPRLSDIVNFHHDIEYPDCLRSVSSTAAIPVRNKWMIDCSDMVMCYVMRKSGGAWKFCQIAKAKGKRVRNLASALHSSS